jgi:hypothetical protein
VLDNNSMPRHGVSFFGATLPVMLTHELAKNEYTRSHT